MTRISQPRGCTPTHAKGILNLNQNVLSAYEPRESKETKLERATLTQEYSSPKRYKKRRACIKPHLSNPTVAPPELV